MFEKLRLENKIKKVIDDLKNGLSEYKTLEELKIYYYRKIQNTLNEAIDLSKKLGRLEARSSYESVTYFEINIRGFLENSFDIECFREGFNLFLNQNAYAILLDLGVISPNEYNSKRIITDL